MENTNTVTINDVDLPIKVYHSQRVVTFKDIDAVHRRPEDTARKRFNDNKKRFIEGEDYFKVPAKEYRNKIGDLDKYCSCNIILITESGYLLLVKSLTDDYAWKVQKDFMNAYFRAKDTKQVQPRYLNVDQIRALAKIYTENLTLFYKSLLSMTFDTSGPESSIFDLANDLVKDKYKKEN